MTNELRRLVSDASRVLAAAGQGDLVWGHASARDPAGDDVWIKVAGWGLDEVDEDRVHRLDASGSVVEGHGTPHNEFPIHTEIMAARPDVGGVVHTHAPHTTALGAAGQPLRPVSHSATMFVPPDVPRFTDTADLVQTPQLGKQLASCLGDARAVLLVNHGLVTVGPDLRAATVAAVVLEQAARQQLLTHALGGWPTWSPDDEALSKREHIYSQAAVDSVWDYLIRKLDAAGRC
jgi:L-ribulose-5-phosphate 4-epimerase